MLQFIHHRALRGPVVRTHGNCIEGTWPLVRAAIVAVAKVFQGQVALDIEISHQINVFKGQVALDLEISHQIKVFKSQAAHVKKEGHPSKQASEQASNASKKGTNLACVTCLLA